MTSLSFLKPCGYALTCDSSYSFFRITLREASLFNWTWGFEIVWNAIWTEFLLSTISLSSNSTKIFICRYFKETESWTMPLAWLIWSIKLADYSGVRSSAISFVSQMNGLALSILHSFTSWGSGSPVMFRFHPTFLFYYLNTNSCYSSSIRSFSWSIYTLMSWSRFLRRSLTLFAFSGAILVLMLRSYLTSFYYICLRAWRSELIDDDFFFKLNSSGCIESR